ncbi:MAG TPA: serine hydrolase domain-containing protein [Pyrinomonadaceae bacterium]|nr:serine hydrolase domain-containing protein [Pyrinomonadaceae bacterium]
MSTCKNNCFSQIITPRWLVVRVLAVALIVLINTYSYAQNTSPSQDKTAEVDKIFSSATATTPGCTVAVSQQGKLIVNKAYGVADLERDVALNPNSIFDLGSVRKQFVAAAVLLLVEDGKLALTDDIRKHFPELPDYGHKITVDHLLTHTSGIRDWTGLRGLMGGNVDDVVKLTVRQRGLNFAPGEEWSYSNSGYVLLTDLVARASGMSFPEFTRKRMFEPLGMKTTMAPSDLRDVIKNRALGYEKEGNSWRVGMYVGNERGSQGGAVLSTATDLLIWNDALTNGRLGKFVTDKLQEPASLNNGRKLRYARGLMINPFPGGTLVSHSGSASGYSAWLGRIPSENLSIAVLCNSDVASASALAQKVGDLFAPDSRTAETAASRPAAAEGAGASTVDLNSRAGLFVNQRTGELLRLIVNNGRLGVEGGGPLAPVTADRFRNPRGNLFFMSQDEFEVNFVSKDEFELKSMEGQTTRYTRVQPYAPTAADLQAFAGRYASDEIGSAFKIVPGNDGLVVHLEGSSGKGSEIRPVHRDTFQVARVILRFVRDKDGKVVGMDYSNPVVRNIRFIRG